MIAFTVQDLSVGEDGGTGQICVAKRNGTIFGVAVSVTLSFPSGEFVQSITL